MKKIFPFVFILLSFLFFPLSVHAEEVNEVTTLPDSFLVSHNTGILFEGDNRGDGNYVLKDFSSTSSTPVYVVGYGYPNPYFEGYDIVTLYFFSESSFTINYSSNYNNRGFESRNSSSNRFSFGTFEYTLALSFHSSNYNFGSLNHKYYCTLEELWNEVLLDATPQTSSYDSSLGYVKNIKLSNNTLTYTNGGKEWTNVVSFDQLTSTGFDLLTEGATVEYFFIFSGTYSNAFGFGNTSVTMQPYTSDAWTTYGTSFTYSSSLWREMYNEWIELNNLSATDRVKVANVSIWMHPVYDRKFGEWTKINEDRNSYLLDSEQPFGGSEDPSDHGDSLGSSTPIDNTQNGNPVNTFEQIASGDVDVSQLVSSIRIFVDGGQAFIGLFRTYFSWLPDWVIAFVGLSVTIWAIMIVKRAILG